MGKFLSCRLPPYLLLLPCPVLPPASPWVQPAESSLLLGAALVFSLVSELSALMVGSNEHQSRCKARGGNEEYGCGKLDECFSTEDYEPGLSSAIELYLQPSINGMELLRSPHSAWFLQHGSLPVTLGTFPPDVRLSSQHTKFRLLLFTLNALQSSAPLCYLLLS